MKNTLIPILALAIVGSSSVLFGAAAPDAAPSAPAASSQPPVYGGPRTYETDEISIIVNKILSKNDRDFERGERLFKQVSCSMCHLFGGGEGGIGPDLSGVGGRFGTREIIESILEPDATISDLYGMKEFTLTNGKTDKGKFVSADDDETTIVRGYSIDPITLTAFWGNDVVKIKNSEIESVEESKASNMIPGLINSLKEDEVADLVAFLISGGNPTNNLFKNFKKPATAATPAATPGAAPAAPAAATPPATPPAK